MTFLNATLLLGCLAAILPVAFHLLGKREPQRVAFPAIRFLTQRIETTRRKVQVRRWVLLAMRVAMIALLALALAQPEIHQAALGQWLAIGALGGLGLVVIGLAVWAIMTERERALRWGLATVGAAMLVLAGGWGLAAGVWGTRPVRTTAAPAAVAFLIDNGPTMTFQTERNENRFEAAKEMASWVLGRFPSNSRFALLDRAPRPAAFALDAASIQKGLQRTKITQAPRSLPERVEAAVNLLRTSDLPRKVLFVFTDLSQNSWQTGGNDDFSALLASIAQEPPVTIQIVDVGSDQYLNRSLGRPILADPTPPRDVASTLTIDVVVDRQPAGLTGGASIEDASTNNPLTLQLQLYEQAPGMPVSRDGEIQYPPLRTVDRTTIAPAGKRGEATLTLPPLPLGTHHGYIELVDRDALPLDNIRYFTVRVAPARRILIVADDEGIKQSIVSMLNPFGNDDSRREYQIDFTSLGKLQETNLSDYTTIGLFNPAVPISLIRDRLEAWVQNGGRLLVSLGPALNEDPDRAGSWELIGRPKRIWRIAEPGRHMQIVDPNHPSLSALAAIPGGAPWNAFRVYYYWQLSDEAQWQALMKVAGTEHPGIVERRLGQGRILLLTTPLPESLDRDAPWNDLLSSVSGDWEVYVILFRQIFEDLSGGQLSELNSLVGSPIALGLESGAANQWQLFPPDGVPVAVDSQGTTLVPGIPQVAGNYWLRSTQGETIGYAANLMPTETDLSRIETEQLQKILGEESLLVVQDRDEIQWAEGAATDGRPLYPLVMMVILVVFVLESVLANRFYSTRKASASSRRTTPQASTVSS